MWNRLSEGGEVLMELGKYDFSPLYGWIKDRFGMTWQLILTDPGGDPRPPIMPSMLFVGGNCGKAEEAGSFYRTIIPSSDEGLLVKYPAGMEPDKEGTVMFSDFRLGDSWITAADSAHDHRYQFNEALSFIIYCNDQEEIDYFWNKLSAVPEAEQCGWLKDRYGVSWQIVPDDLRKMMEGGSDSQKESVTKAFLEMKKLDIGILRKAFDNAR
jgi:predicted 3-demethylubiquinone-9 3-methyltransferase (glyoxalase superfamily)